MSKIGVLISVVKTIISGFAEVKQARPHLIPEIFLKHFELRSLLFLPAYCGSFKFINCLLNRIFKEDTTKHTIMAGFLSGSFYMFYPQFTLVSFAFIRSVQLLWLKHVKDYKGKDKVRNSMKSLPMGVILLWSTVTILFVSRFMYPYMSSKYIIMCLNYISGSL